MSLKLVLVLRSSPHEACFHYMVEGFEQEFFRHLEASIGVEATDSYTPEERLMFVFAPLAFTNSKAMEEAPEFFCKSLELDDDHVVVCEVIGEFHLFIVFQSCNYSDIYIKRQFDTIRELFTSLLGPCWSFLIPSRKRSTHIALRNLLRAMIIELLYMQSTEFQHLFSAMEHLSVQREHKITGVTALEHACTRMAKRLRGQSGAIKHSLILAGTKLFALYSNAPNAEMSTKNTLLISLLTRALFHHDSREDIHNDEFVTAGSSSQSQAHNSENPTLPSEEESFFSPPEDLSVTSINGNDFSTSLRTTLRSHTIVNSLQVRSDSLEEAQEAATVLSDTLASDQNGKSVIAGSSRASEISSLSDFESLFTQPDTSIITSLEPVVSEIATSEKYRNRLDYRFMRLVLDSSPGEVGVFGLHIVRISRQLVAVFFQESQEMTLSTKMTRASALTRAQRQKQGEHLRPLLQLCHEINIRMSDLFGSDIRECRELSQHYSSLQKIDAQWNASSSSRVEQQVAMNDTLDHLYTCLADMFGKLYLRFPWPVPQSTTDIVASCARQLQDRLRDYIPYLEVKALRNLAPTSFKCSMPGMVHFVWVDRDRDRVVSPTLDPEELSPEFAVRIRHRAEYCRELYLQTNHKDIFCKDAYLQYSYRVISKSYKRRIPMPNSNYYNDLGYEKKQHMRQIDAHELLVVHLAHVTRDSVKQDVKRILENFTRQTDDINSSLGLLA